MKYLLPLVLLCLFLLLPFEVFASPSRPICDENDSRFGSLCKISPENLSQNLGNLFSIMLLLAAVISVIFLIWGAIKWIRSGGDKAGVDSARNTIIAAIVGLLISLFAFFIVNFVLYAFLGKSGPVGLPRLTTGACKGPIPVVCNRTIVCNRSTGDWECKQ